GPDRNRPRPAADDHGKVRWRARRGRGPGRRPERRARRDRGHPRAVSDPGGIPGSHAARADCDRARLRVLRPDGPQEGHIVVRTLRPVKITGLSTYVPPRVLSNADLEKMVKTTDEWIVQRTGIRERHIVDPGVATSDLAQAAAR